MDEILPTKKKKRSWPPELTAPFPDIHEAELLKKKRKIAEKEVGVPREEREEE